LTDKWFARVRARPKREAISRVGCADFSRMAMPLPPSKGIAFD